MNRKQTLLARKEYFFKILEQTQGLQETLEQLCCWTEHISGGIYHTLNSSAWNLGVKLLGLSHELEKQIEEIQKIVLRFQTWEGLKQRKSKISDEQNFKGLDAYALTDEESESLLALLELEISALQLLKAKLVYNIEEIKTWLVQIQNSYQIIIGSKTWKTGNRLTEGFKRVFKSKSSLNPWPQEVKYYLDKFNAWHSSHQKLEGNKAFLDREVESKIFYKLEEENPPLVSLILVNPKNDLYLKRFLNSFLVHNSLASVEFVVFTNEVTPQSCLKQIQDFSKLLPIQTIGDKISALPSSLKNYAAEISKAKFIFFLEENLIFREDLLPELIAQANENQDLSLLGVRIYASEEKQLEDCLSLKHAGIKFREDQGLLGFAPFTLTGREKSELAQAQSELVPAISSQAMFCIREDFLKIGGFSKNHLHCASVNLALCFYQHARKCIMLNHLALIDQRSAAELDLARTTLLDENKLALAELKQNFGYALKRALLSDKFAETSFWSIEKPLVAFAVTEAGAQATAGDYFTAYELANECRRLFGWRIKFLAERDKYGSWYDLRDVDLLITMVDEYDLRQIQNAKNNLITVAWLRNWFDRWAEQPWFQDYNLCLCSSEKSAQFIRDNYDKAAIVFRIATNEKRFSAGPAREEYLADCAFTGNYWKAKREIEDAFSPEENGINFAIYGHAWENHPKFGKYHRGFIPYQELSEVYRSTKIIFDDANQATKSWGSVNSRVFDALASGCLVISNGEEGVAEIFADRLPTYSSAEDLEKKVNYYLSKDAKRKELVSELKEQVLKKHTYAHRAEEFRSHLLDFTKDKYRIAIKAPVPRIEEAEAWGDYHFAGALKQEFEKLGHSVRIDLMPDWHTPKQMADQVAIVLRGLSAYTPNPEQINLIWNISHPDKVSAEEYNKYDHVFVASSVYTKQLQGKLSVPVSTLFQCTNEKYFYPEKDVAVPAHDLLFVGNSRKEYRQIVKDAIQSNLPLSVYGTNWESIIEQRYIVGQNIPNKELRKYYSSAKIVLNDHWPAMSKNGFISNRIFDAAACGACIISDQIDGAEELFSDALCTYKDAKELKEKVEYFLSDERARITTGERLRDLVKELHTFKDRVSKMLKVIDQLDRRRRFPEISGGNKESLEITKSYPEASQKSVINL